MLKKQQQKKRFNKVWGNMLKRFRHFAETKSPGELHQMRVEIKKVKALLTFLKGHAKRKKLVKYFKPVRKIFTHAGIIRKAQLNIRYIEKYHPGNENFKNLQSSVADAESASFIGKKKEYAGIIKHAQKKFVGNLFDIKSKVILSTFKKELKKLNTYFAKAGKPGKKLHLHRKRIKLILYMYPLLPKKYAVKLRINIPYLKQLQQAIGKWHDLFTAAKLLSANGLSDKDTLDALQKEQQNQLFIVEGLSSNFTEKVKQKPA